MAISRGFKFGFLPPCGIIKVIFKLHIFLQIFEKRGKHDNMYSAKMSTLTATNFHDIYYI